MKLSNILSEAIERNPQSIAKHIESNYIGSPDDTILKAVNRYLEHRPYVNLDDESQIKRILDIAWEIYDSQSSPEHTGLRDGKYRLYHRTKSLKSAVGAIKNGFFQVCNYDPKSGDPFGIGKREGYPGRICFAGSPRSDWEGFGPFIIMAEISADKVSTRVGSGNTSDVIKTGVRKGPEHVTNDKRQETQIFDNQNVKAVKVLIDYGDRIVHYRLEDIPSKPIRDCLLHNDSDVIMSIGMDYKSRPFGDGRLLPDWPEGSRRIYELLDPKYVAGTEHWAESMMQYWRDGVMDWKTWRMHMYGHKV